MEQKKAAILVIDMLNDFIGGALKCERAEAIVSETARLLKGARRAHVPVIFTNDAHLKGVDHELALWGEHAMAGTEGAKITPALGPEEGDYVVEKRRYSAFFHTGLDPLLRELGTETVILAGIQAHICVQHTAADAYFRGYDVVLADGLIEAFTEELLTTSMGYMSEMYGAKRMSVDAILKTYCAR